jgi:hypothetical protein
MDWIHLNQDRDQWWVHKKWGISILGEKLVASEERLCSMELFIYLFKETRHPSSEQELSLYLRQRDKEGN